MLSCLLDLQGIAQIARLLKPHRLSETEAADVIRLSEDMGVFDQCLTALLRAWCASLDAFC
jgi:hypothetical protein